MLNHSLKLNTKIFNEDIEKKSTRQGFGEGLVVAATNDSNIMVLTADLKESTKVDLFAERFPERFIEVGISEQNMAATASGIASMGKKPVITSYSMFNPGRNWEQIRTTICYNDQPVKIIGSHSGLSVGPDGGSHQALEDIAITRVIPNMIVISPCDYCEAKKAIIESLKINKPTYIRLTRNDTPTITTEETPFKIGEASFIYGPDFGFAEVGIIATGPILYKAILAAKELEKQNIKVKVLNISTIKPLDEEKVLSLARETKAIITIEDHQISGGLYGAISEFLSKTKPTIISPIGIKDTFGQSGSPSELENHYGLTVENIIFETKNILKNKNFK